MGFFLIITKLFPKFTTDVIINKEFLYLLWKFQDYFQENLMN